MTSRLCACLSSTHQDPGGALTSLHGGDLIFSVDGVVSAEEAARLVAFGEASGFATQFHEADDEVTFRHNDRLAIADEGFALALWERLRRHVPLVRGAEPVGCSSNIRLYKYTEGMRFGRHVDGSHADPASGNRSEYTVLIYLNDAAGSEQLCGGATNFYAGEYHDPDVEESLVLSFEPRRGAALLHGHGERCLLHEGCEVTSGVKYLLRTDVLFAAPPSKRKKKKRRK
jgi:hypothetical protein